MAVGGAYREATGIFAPMYNTPAYTARESVEKKVFEIDSDVLRCLSDFSKGESPTDRQPGSSNPRGPQDQLLNRGPREVIIVSNNV